MLVKNTLALEHDGVAAPTNSVPPSTTHGPHVRLCIVHPRPAYRLKRHVGDPDLVGTTTGSRRGSGRRLVLHQLPNDTASMRSDTLSLRVDIVALRVSTIWTFRRGSASASQVCCHTNAMLCTAGPVVIALKPFSRWRSNSRDSARSARHAADQRIARSDFARGPASDGCDAYSQGALVHAGLCCGSALMRAG